MSALHVVYRVHDEGKISEDWAAYTFPIAIFTGGRTLSETRAEAEELIADALGDDLDDTPVVEHIERQMFPGAYVRVALDKHEALRDEVADAIRAMLAEGPKTQEQRDDFEARMPLAASGDTITVACVAEDTIRWVLDQMAPQDTVAVCALGPTVPGHRLVYWNYLVREGVSAGEHAAEREESLAEAEIEIDSSVSAFVRSTASTRRGLVVGAGAL